MQIGKNYYLFNANFGRAGNTHPTHAGSSLAVGLFVSSPPSFPLSFNSLRAFHFNPSRAEHIRLKSSNYRK